MTTTVFRRLALASAIVAVLCSPFSSSVRAQRPAAPPKATAPAYVTNRVLVKPRAGLGASSLAPQHAAIGARVRRTFPAIGNLQVIDLPAAVSVAAAIDHYRRGGLVEYAEPDYIVSLIQAQNIPNDLSTSLWGLNNTGQSGGTVDADIDAPEAWSTALDSSAVIIGVVDTGVDYTHPDLAANMWRNPGETAGDGIDNDGNGYVDDVFGINAIAGNAAPGNPMDDNRHGTHVAGTIGAVGHNGQGVVGVSWTARIMALKFLSASGSGSTSDAIACIDYARAKGAKVLNNSWGGGGYSQGLYDAIARARQAGIIFVAAAGNDATDTDGTTYYPQGYALDNVVAVQSTDRYDAMSSFSNYGYDSVDLGAPGSSIYSTLPGGTYGTLSGTSMATPHVAGAFALLAAARPDLSTHTALIDQVLGTVDRIPGLAGTTRTGGRLNLARALTGTAAPTSHLKASPLGGGPGLTVTFTDESFGSITSRVLDFGDGSPTTTVVNTTHTYASNGTYVARLTVTGPGGTHTSSRTISIQPNYEATTTAYGWVDTAGFATATLTDDAATGAIALPFPFTFYGTTYSSVFIGSNGLLTFGSNAGATAFGNGPLPSTGTPNAAVYALWDDLDPTGSGAIKYGTAPDGSFVVSWEGVPAYGTTAAMTFQAILEAGGAIRVQYLEVQPGNTSVGAGRSATVGVENGAGTIARTYSLNGTPLLANGTAIRFQMPGSPATPPAAPAGLTATASSSSAIALVWIDQADNETGYRVERWNGTTFGTLATLASNSTSYTNSGLSPSTSYTYRVVAFNDAGASGPSNQASATTLAPPPPAAPSALAATVSGSTVSLSWTDNATTETGFTLQRATDSLFTANVTTFALGANVQTYADTPASLGTYYYRVRAENTGGASAWSGTVSATITSLPSAPTGLAATALAGRSIRLNWTDTASNETGFDIQEATNSTFTSGLRSVTVGANTGTYTFTGRTAGRTYFYRVRSRNSAGVSAWTATASATARK